MASSINAITTGSGGVVTTADNSGNLNLQSGGTTVVAVTSAGAAVTGTLSASTTGQVGTTLGVGGATPSASGAGITFPATQSASTDANTLDDYEEGTWTPSITFGGASVGVTYSSYRGGTYSKIGNRVFVTGIVELTNKGSSTGAARISGLPFTNASGNDRYFSATIGGYFFTFTGQYWGEIQQNTSAILINQNTEAGAQSSLTNTNFTNTTLFEISAHYSI